MITVEDYQYFAVKALTGMSSIVAELGDDLANRKPAMPGANSPYALLTHCLGVVSFWAGHLVAGRDVERDRDAEFTASGPVQPLLDQVPEVIRQLEFDAASAEPRSPLHRVPPRGFRGPDRVLDQGAALLHVFEELAQHHGQMQITRDIVRAEAGEN